MEVRKELLEEVGLLRRKLVVAEALAAVLHLVGGDTLADVAVEHLQGRVSISSDNGQWKDWMSTYVIRDDGGVGDGILVAAAGAPELPPRLLLLLGLRL